MAETGTLIINGTGDEAKFVYSKTIEDAGEHSVNFTTKNSFLDKDINISITTPAASALAFDADDITTSITMGDAENGVYEPVATIAGKVTVEDAGWITSGDHAISEANVKLGKVNQSVLKKGNTTIASGSEITPSAEDQTINITEGYNGARTVVVKAASEMDPAEISSGNATISSLTYTADDANHTFDITGSETIPAPGVNTPGYISSTKGTKNAGTATVSTTVDQVTVGVNVTGTAKVTPEIARTAKPAGDAWVDAASGAATTSKPSAGAYVQIDVAGKTSTLTAAGKVTAAGYGTTSDFQADAATQTTVGSNAAATAYVPIAAGTVASGTAEISSVNVAYNTTGGNFDISGSANIPAPTVSAAGYVGNSVGSVTGATDGATVAASVAKIGIKASLTGTGTAKPVIAKNAATNIDASDATTTQPSVGHYIAVASAANTSNVKATASVTSAGYGTTTSGQYTTADSDALTVGAAASDVTYIPIASAAFANSATSGKTYTDISSSAPVLISNDFLYIDGGYTDNVKISLAKLVPDEATISSSTGAGYMLSGQSAYDSNGVLVVGTIPTYDGAYTVA